MSASETTPLLSGDAPAAPTPDLEQAESSPLVTPAPADDFAVYFTRRIKLLTRFNLISTIISALTLLAASITVANGPFYSTWDLQEALRLLGGMIFCAFVMALINTRFPTFPNGLNVIADFFLAVVTLNLAANLFACWPRDWCNQGKETARIGCQMWLIAVEVLMGVGAGLGVLVGLAHLLMLVLRAVAIFKAGFSSQASRGTNGGLPSGELSFQFSIKFLRQQDTATGQANHSTATSGSEVA